MSESQIYLAALGGLLVFQGIINSADELSPDNLKEQVSKFQDKAGLFVDGKPGRDTLWALQFDPVTQGPKQNLVDCPADVVPGYEEGLPSTRLRADVAERFQALRSEVLSLGGFVTSDGGLRTLTADVNQNRSPSSMHYTGLAFDLFTNSGFFRPNVDPFVVSRGSETHWVVWCRATGGEEKQLTAVYWQSESSGIDLTKAISGKFINFTELCRRHGFHSIGPRPAFTRSHNRSYLSAEWWHFQCNDLLVPSLSQFGIELLKLKGYSSEFIRGKSEAVWERRKLIYGRDWR